MRYPRFYAFVFVCFVALAATSVFAINPREGSYVEHRIGFDRSTATTRITGSLICQMAETNTGSGCDLKLKESVTGVIYTLENAGSARRLFHDGVRDVAVTGTRTGDTSFKVTSASAR